MKAGFNIRNLLRSVRILSQGCDILNISLTAEAQVLNGLLCLLQSASTEFVVNIRISIHFKIPQRKQQDQ